MGILKHIKKYLTDIIDELASLSTVQKVNVLLITPDAAESHSRGPELQKILQNSNIYEVTLTVRTPLKQEQDIIESATTLQEIDFKIGNKIKLQNRPSCSNLWIVFEANRSRPLVNYHF